MAQQEDDWDDIVNQQAGKNLDDNTTSLRDSEKWVDAVKASEQDNLDAYRNDLTKDKMITRKMQRIVDQETELALWEGQTIIRGRKRRPLSVVKPPSSS